MSHVERTMDQRGSAYSLFQTAIMLEGRVRTRTEELTGLMHRLERSNEALAAAKEEAETANRSKTPLPGCSEPRSAAAGQLAARPVRFRPSPTSTCRRRRVPSRARWSGACKPSRT